MTKVSTIRAVLLGGAAALAMTAAGQVAYADDDAEEAERIVVTGSRIARDPNLASPVPVQFVNSDDLLITGDFNITETINDIPALLASTTSEQSVFTTATDGQNTLNLRGLGTDRTLVLVNGRRHVSGVEGEQSVDVGSIPTGLIERVEVLTGGASAIYGADAVTGVVNFVLRDDYEGAQIDVSAGASWKGDAQQVRAFGLFGRNFANDRGNIVVNVEYSEDDGLRKEDRPFTAGYYTAADWSNPARRFQLNDIGGSTPNFANYYDFDNTGLFSRGLLIPSAANFIANYENAFGVTPVLTAAELALIDRAATAPPRLIAPYPTFSITSAGGVISPADFSLAPGFDLDGNGTDDCLDSFVGYNNSFDGAASFGAAGGCWNVLTANQVVPVEDGLIAGSFNHFGGSGILPDDRAHIIGVEDKIAVNVNSHYEFSPLFEAFVEAKIVEQEIYAESPYNTYWDLIYIDPSNPFIPSVLQPVADATGGLYITRDHNDLGFNRDTVERTTTRIVGGFRGEFANGWSYELAANRGEFELTSTDGQRPIIDRLLAATDVTTDVNGDPICRSELGGLDYPVAPFDIPMWDGGFFTFTPGEGDCVPFNPFGVGSPSEAAIDWITTSTHQEQEVTQTVYSASLLGDSEQLFSLPGGPIGFAVGLEYREETSEIQYDPLELGIVPIDGQTFDGTPVPAGSLLRDFARPASLVFDPAASFSNSSGEYDVFDYFGEVTLPLLADLPLVDSLSVDGAIRVADYSTIGKAETWKVGGTWAPVRDLSFRVTQSEAIRAPNIFELFSPDQGTTFRPVDPCDVNEIPTAENPALREANCVAYFQQIGLAASAYSTGGVYDFVDPLSARFFGVEGGNPNLDQETAETLTYGFVLQPRFIEGLSVSVDYWEVEITDAISAISDQDIVDLCVDSSSIDNDYCPLFTRNPDSASAQAGGLTFLRQTQVNFGKLDASGIDVDVRYAFDIGQNGFSLGVSGSTQDKLDRYFDPSDPTLVDPELGELFFPEWAGQANLGYERGPLALLWSTRFQGEQLLRGAEVESYLDVFGPSVLMDALYIHDLAGTYTVDDRLTLRAGVNNLTNEEPFITEQSWAAGSRGRYFFVGANLALQ
jgi:outer membrane receptor protein involved in Fe transport